MTTKNKVLDISGLPKKLKKSEIAAIADKPARKKISKTSTGQLKSIIGDSAEEIQELLEQNHTDSATTLMQKRLLQTLIDVLPYAENTIRETGGSRGVYQLNSIITSLREVIIDIQATKDKGAIGDALVERVIRPAFLDIGMQLVLEDERMLKEIKDEVDPNVYKRVREIHRTSLQRTAAGIQAKYEESKKQAIGFLQQ
jgi:hypothetical protein